MISTIDFPEDTSWRGCNGKQNLIKSWNDHFSIELNYYKNLLQANPLAGNVTLSTDRKFRFPKRDPNRRAITFSANFNYLSFSRSGFAWDEISDKDHRKNPQRYISSTCNKLDWSTIWPVKSLGWKIWRQKWSPRTDERAEFDSSIIRPIQLQNLTFCQN